MSGTALEINNREALQARWRIVGSLQCLHPHLSCSPETRSETRAYFMPSGSKQAHRTVDVGYFLDFAYLLGLIPNICGISTSENLVHVLQREDVGFLLFQLNMENVAVWIALLSLYKQGSLWSRCWKVRSQFSQVHAKSDLKEKWSTTDMMRFSDLGSSKVINSKDSMKVMDLCHISHSNCSLFCKALHRS